MQWYCALSSDMWKFHPNTLAAGVADLQVSQSVMNIMNSAKYSQYVQSAAGARGGRRGAADFIVLIQFD